MTRRARGDRCVCCGRRDFGTFYDNHGNAYIGCRWCRLLTAEETELLLRAATNAWPGRKVST